MRKDWLHWITGGTASGGGGSRNSKSATKKEAAESASTGCMCAVFHLFHSHHLQFPSFHRNQSHSYSHFDSHSSLQEEAATTTGVEAPRNSLELVEENLNFPVAIQIKTRSRFDEISSECNSPAAKTPIVARLMGLDLLPQQSPSPKCKKFPLRDDVVPLGARSLPETPRTSSSSRKSDVERHRLSLQINHTNDEFAPADRSHHRMTPGRRGRVRQNENRNLVQRAVKHDLRPMRRSFGADVTNTVMQSRRDENLLPLKPAKKISNHKKMKSTMSSSSCGDYEPLLLKKDCRRGGFGARCGSSLRQKKLPPRAAADSAVRGRREGEFVNKLNLRGKMQVRKFKGPSPPPTKLPQKLQVSHSLSSKCSTQLSSKPSQSYNQPQKTASSCGGAAAIHGCSLPEQRSYIQTILKHIGIINQSNPLSKWHIPSHPIDPGIFHRLELSAAMDGGDTALRHHYNRKLIFQLVDELLAEILAPRCSLRRWVSHGGGGPPLAEELCKKIESFPAAKCVVLEDIDSLIDTDLCKSRLNGYFGEEEEIVREIESEVVEWLLHEAVAVMGGGAAAEKMDAGVL